MTPPLQLTLLAIFLPLVCGAATLQGLHERDLPPQSVLPGRWTYSGCYTEAPGGRTLPKDSFSDAAGMNASACISYCSINSYPYAGTEYSSQCWCGVGIDSGATKLNGTACNMPCTGDPTQQCGGPNKLSIYWSGSSGPQTNPGTPPWRSVSCFTEGLGGLRTLTKQVNAASPLTVNSCIASCTLAYYTLAGVEYGSQCFCGNATVNGGTTAPAGDCNMPCAGNQSEWCGGPDRLNLYQYNNAFDLLQPTSTATAGTPTQTAPTIKPTVGSYQYYGCQTEGNNTRALISSATASDSMTLEVCQSFCAGTKYFGTEYGRECYCGNAFSQGSLPVSNSDCGMICSSNKYEFCGSGNRLSVYVLTP